VRRRAEEVGARLGAEGSQVAVGAAAIDDGGGVLARLLGRVRLLERHLSIVLHTPSEEWHTQCSAARERRKGKKGVLRTDKAVALGAAGELVGDDDGLEDVAEPLEVFVERVLVRLPRQPAHENLGQRRVPEH
jgi:hypothetical protein